jgi:NAD(P)-dependent dehydrogenase (short-subunit alcohol dehydrogenase family)
MRILVTGAAGAIGSHVAEALVRRGNDVRGSDSFTPYYSRVIKETNVTEIKNSGVEFVRADLCTDNLTHLLAPAALIVTAIAAAIMAFGMHNAKIAPPVFLAAVIALSALLMNGLAAVFAASLKTVWVAPRLAAAVARNAHCPQPEVASAGYQEPSLVFLLGMRTRLVDAAGAALFLADGGCRIALVTELNSQSSWRRWPGFPGKGSCWTMFPE